MDLVVGILVAKLIWHVGGRALAAAVKLTIERNPRLRGWLRGQLARDEALKHDLEPWRESIVTTLLVGGDAQTLRTAAEVVLG